MRLGISIGEPAGPGKPALCLLYGAGAPSTQVVDPTVMNVQSCALGSLYVDFAGPGFYQKTALPNTWTQMS